MDSWFNSSGPGPVSATQSFADDDRLYRKQLRRSLILCVADGVNSGAMPLSAFSLIITVHFYTTPLLVRGALETEGVSCLWHCAAGQADF